MKMANESTNYKLPSGVEAILRAQPLNPFVRMEFEAGEKSWSTLDPDSSREREARQLKMEPT